MNAQFDYEIVMRTEDMPPAKAFWSATLYDLENGFLIPNDKEKYSVGEKDGFKVNEDGGIRIVISAEQPEDVPDENWLPINRGDYDVDVNMRPEFPKTPLPYPRPHPTQPNVLDPYRPRHFKSPICLTG